MYVKPCETNEHATHVILYYIIIYTHAIQTMPFIVITQLISSSISL